MQCQKMSKEICIWIWKLHIVQVFVVRHWSKYILYIKNKELFCHWATKMNLYTLKRLCKIQITFEQMLRLPLPNFIAGFNYKLKPQPLNRFIFSLEFYLKAFFLLCFRIFTCENCIKWHHTFMIQYLNTSGGFVTTIHKTRPYVYKMFRILHLEKYKENGNKSNKWTNWSIFKVS